MPGNRHSDHHQMGIITRGSPVEQSLQIRNSGRQFSFGTLFWNVHFILVRLWVSNMVSFHYLVGWTCEALLSVYLSNHVDIMFVKVDLRLKNFSNFNQVPIIIQAIQIMTGWQSGELNKQSTDSLTNWLTHQTHFCY